MQQKIDCARMEHVKKLIEINDDPTQVCEESFGFGFMYGYNAALDYIRKLNVCSRQVLEAYYGRQ